LKQGDIQLLRITSKPDSAYEICTKYTPECSSSINLNFAPSSISSSSSSTTMNDRIKENNYKSHSLSTNQRNRTKNLSNRKTEKSRNVNILKVNDAAHDSLELENLNLDLNGEDDYYDSLSSGNEDDALTTLSPSYENEDRIHSVRVNNNEDNYVESEHNQEVSIIRSIYCSNN